LVINIRAKVAVFYGKVDQKRDLGWYWTSVPGPNEPLKGPYNGPFKTKAEAVEDANQTAVIEEKGSGPTNGGLGGIDSRIAQTEEPSHARPD
jgi:hypothetical protein